MPLKASGAASSPFARLLRANIIHRRALNHLLKPPPPLLQISANWASAYAQFKPDAYAPAGHVAWPVTPEADLQDFAKTCANSPKQII